MAEAEEDETEIEEETDVIELLSEELVIDGIDESVTSLLADGEAVAEVLTVVAEAEAERETEAETAEEEEARLVVAAAEEALDEPARELEDDELEDAARELETEELEDATRELELVELGATEVVVVLEVSLPKTYIRYQPPHFCVASPAQLVLHWLSGTMSVFDSDPQKHSLPFCRPYKG